MFVRFRQSRNRLQVSLIETCRVDGKVKQEHVAALGSCPASPTVADRMAFWQELHTRLARLSNRVDAATYGKVLGAVHERIPMVTPDEQAALQLANAETDVRFWNTLHEMYADMAAGHKKLAADASAAVAAGQNAMTNARDNADLVNERVARLKRGEAVTGGLKAITPEEIERIVGKELLRRARLLGDLTEAELSELIDAELAGQNRRMERAARRILRKRN